MGFQVVGFDRFDRAVKLDTGRRVFGEANSQFFLLTDKRLDGADRPRWVETAF